MILPIVHQKISRMSSVERNPPSNHSSIPLFIHLSAIFSFNPQNSFLVFPLRQSCRNIRCRLHFLHCPVEWNSLFHRHSRSFSFFFLHYRPRIINGGAIPVAFPFSSNCIHRERYSSLYFVGKGRIMSDRYRTIPMGTSGNFVFRSTFFFFFYALMNA